VLFSPQRAFATLRADSVRDPLVFAVLLGTAGAAAALAWEVAWARLGLDPPPWARWGGRHGQALVLAMLAALPAAIAIALACLSLAVHTFLGMVGGARRSLRLSFAVLAYALGAGAAVAVVPMIGGALGLFWAVLSSITGLAVVHGTGRARAAFAVLVPLVIASVVGTFAALVGWAIVSAARAGR
jgi:hypothetical protein